jgi:hypothetical protein
MADDTGQVTNVFDFNKLRELADRHELAVRLDESAPEFHLSKQDMQAIIFCLRFTAGRIAMDETTATLNAASDEITRLRAELQAAKVDDDLIKSRRRQFRLRAAERLRAQAAAITRLRAELAKLQSYVSMQQSGHLKEAFDELKSELAAARAHALETYKRWHQLEDKLRADVIAALQRADDYRKMWQENYDDVRRADEALAAERAARERIEKELRRKAHDAILTSSKVAYTDAAAIVALAAPAEASAGEADTRLARQYADIIEATDTEAFAWLLGLEDTHDLEAEDAKAMIVAALRSPARPAQKDSQ